MECKLPVLAQASIRWSVDFFALKNAFFCDGTVERDESFFVIRSQTKQIHIGELFCS